VPYPPTALRSHRWALDGYPYLAFCDKLPFQGELLTLLAGSVEDMRLDHDRHGWHLPRETTKSWKQLEHTLRHIAKQLKEWFHASSPYFPFFLVIEPQLPSKFGYFTTHSTEDAARSGLRSSLDSFSVYIAYVSFLAALCQFTDKAGDPPSWLKCLERPGVVHPEFLNLFKTSHIVDFSGERTCVGTIIDVLACSWSCVTHILLKAKVPIWLYWGYHPLRVTPRAGWMAGYRPLLVDLDLPHINKSLSQLPQIPLPSQPQSQLSACGVTAHRRRPNDQLPGETYEQYFIRRQIRNEARMKTETAQNKEVRANQERAAAGRQYPGRRGPAVYYWEPDSNDFRVRTLQTRAQAQKLWEVYSNSQKVFDSFENEWDCCSLFGDDPDTDEDDASTASNVIPENATGSTLPPPHEKPISSNLSPVASLEDKAKSQDVLMNLDTQSLPYSPRNSPLVSSASSYHDHRPALGPRDDSPKHYYDRPRHRARDDSPTRYYVHQRNLQNDSPEQYHERRPYRDSRDDSPWRYHRNQSRDRPLRRDSPTRYHDHGHNRYSGDHRPRYDNPKHHHRDRDLRDGRSRPMHHRSRSHSREPYQRNSNAMVPSDHRQESDDDLLSLSGALVLSVHPPNPTISFGIQTDSLVDHVYYRFGFHLDENPYTGIPSSAYSITFGNWLEVRRSIGCHQLDGSLTHCQPIQDFLQCLLSTDDPLCDVPAKFWDLNTSNIASLNLAAGFVRIEPKKFSDGITCYLIRPVGLHASRDSSWILAVDAMTALECVCRRLGPHTIDIANFLINRGIPFSTL